MKNTKIMQVTSLFVAAFLLAAVNIIVAPDAAFADPPACKGKNKANCDVDDGDGKSGNLQAKFDLTIETMPPNISGPISGSDGYQDSKKEHVSIATGSGDGFRFDTNTQNVNKVSRWRSAEVVLMSVSVDGIPNTTAEPYEIDFRFNQTTGLDLGSLAMGDSGTVAAAFKYFGGKPVDGFDVSNHGVLAFKELTTSPTMSDEETCLAKTAPIEVKRNDNGTWTLKSTPPKHLACAFAIDANGDIECTQSTPCSSEGGPIALPFEFEFTLTRQP